MQDWTDEDAVLVSAIEHYSYCPRQCALIHVEKVFDENIFTLRGSMAHERVDVPAGMEEHGVRVEKSLPIWSDRYGLYGRADVVEFRADGTVYPVEYKLGPKRAKKHDALQLCGQALCLEEMLICPVTRGAVYHSSSRTRREVDFTDDLRQQTLEIVEAIRAVQKNRRLPPPANDARCRNCSLLDACLPSGVAAASAADAGSTLFRPGRGEVSE